MRARAAEVGARIRELREARGLTQAALAKRAGIGRVTLARIEVGAQAPSPWTLSRLARALKVKVEIQTLFTE